jgi:transposase-like protein
MSEGKKRKRHTPEQVIAKLREADAMLAGGASVGQVCQRLEVSEATLNRWRNQYGGMKAGEAKRLKELEQENARLKRIVADQALDITMLKDLQEGKW